MFNVKIVGNDSSRSSKIGDILRANQGERIAADGVVEQGSGWCDESHLTGESQPLEKMSQSPVLAGGNGDTR